MTRQDEKIGNDALVIVDSTNYLKRTTIYDFELIELQKPIFINGKLVYNDPEIMEKQRYCNEQMEKLWEEVKRTLNPHKYYVDGTEEYVNFKNQMITRKRSLTK